MRAVPLKPCLALIHAFEGQHGDFEPTRTLDPVGNWEIGWSHKLSGPDDPLWDASLTQAQADDLAIADLGHFAQGVCDALNTQSLNDLSDNQYAACIDFAYNAGAANFAASHLCALINTGNLTLAVQEFPKWVYAHQNGKAIVLPGLVRRRQAEVDIWNAPPAP